MGNWNLIPLASWNVCFSSKFRCGSPHPESDGVRRWDLKKIIAHECEILMDGNMPL
jgi:hypothetical protein